MSRRLLDYDPLTGVTTYHHYDEMSDTTAIETVQDVTPTLEVNKAMANDDDYKRHGIKQSWWHVASIPVVVQEKWLREDGVNVFNPDHWPAVKRKLNDIEYRYLRTATGRV